jgi:hypothetical protein
MANPSVPDLLKDSSDPLGTDNEYFLVTIVDLELATTYPIEFAWKYKDGTVSEDWSAAYKVTTLAESAPLAPRFEAADLTNDGASLVIRWGGLDSLGNAYGANFDRVEIFAKGGSFGSSYVNTGYVFKEAGTKVIAVSTGATYYVKLRAVTKRGTVSDFSTERTATTVQQLVVDVQGPANVSSGGLSISAGVDNAGTIGFNGFLDLSWTAVSDSTLRGYRIRFRTGTSNYSYVDSPGTGTTYRLRGLAVGATYEVGIATYDELNNTSSAYTSFTTTAISGTPFVGTNVNTTGYFSAGTAPNDFQFGFGVDPSNNSNTFVGTKRGLYFTESNYWLIDSAQSARLKIGGPTSNYLEWNGSLLAIDGNITAKGGSFSGNILMSSTNASLYNISSGHTINSNGTLPAGSTGFVLNASGLQFKYAGSEKITLNATTGQLVATDVEITGSIKAGSNIYGSKFVTSTADSGARIEMGNSLSDTVTKIAMYDSNGSQGGIGIVIANQLGIWSPGDWGGSASLAFYGPSHSTNPNIIESRKQMRHDYSFTASGSATASQRFFRNIGIQSGDLTAGTSDPSGSGKSSDIILIWE